MFVCSQHVSDGVHKNGLRLSISVNIKRGVLPMQDSVRAQKSHSLAVHMTKLNFMFLER